MMKALTYNPVKEQLERSIENSRKRISVLILEKDSEVDIRRELDEIEKLKVMYC